MRDLSRATGPATTHSNVVVVPVGSLEQHGPHLPLGTDTVIAVAVAEQVVGAMKRTTDGVWLAPALSYGASGEHQDFSGTCSIGANALRHVVVELVRSIRTWADRVVFVNAHGGNLRALREAVDQMVGEGHDVTCVSCRPRGPVGDAHAGWVETSLMLHLQPHAVHLDRMHAGTTAPIAEILPELLIKGVAGVSPNGVLGDPAGASAGAGARLLQDMVDDVLEQVRTRVS